MEYLISENQLKFLINEIEYDPEVEKIQKRVTELMVKQVR